jgi:hypothetical protein
VGRAPLCKAAANKRKNFKNLHLERYSASIFDKKKIVEDFYIAKDFAKVAKLLG